MANFRVHASGAAITSGLLASSFLTTGLYTRTDIVLLWLLGCLGGILPDIDSDNSTSLNGIFTAMGVAASFTALWLLPELPLLQLWLVMLAVFVLVRHGVLYGFAKLTRHRGIFHSILAAVAFALATVHISHTLFACDADLAWAMGISVFAGYITHLVLDECYAVDLANNAIKRSFGSAIKLFSVRYYCTSLACMLISVYLFFQVPTADRLTTVVFSARNQQLAYQLIDRIQDQNNRLLDGLKDNLAPSNDAALRVE